MKCCDLYKSLKNPLYDNEILEDIVDTYSNSSNFNEDILKVNSKNDYSIFGDDLEDKNIFYNRLFVLWKITLNNIFARGHLTRKEKLGFLKFYSYLDSYRFDTADDILKHINPDNVLDSDLKGLLSKYRWDFKSKDLFKEYNFSDITCASAEKEKREHSLYLNIDRRYIYKFIDVFVNECFKKQKNFDFKFNNISKRDDCCIIYASNENFEDMINMINLVFEKNPELFEHVNKPPVMTSPITDYIGYSSYSEDNSYNSVRSNLISKSIDKTTREWIRENQNKSIKVQDSGNMFYKDYFLGLVYLYKTKDLQRMASNNKDNPNYTFIREEEIDTEEYQSAFKRTFDLFGDKIINAACFNEKISVNLRVGNNIINISNKDIDLIVKHQAKVLYVYDDNYKYRLRDEIWCNSKDYGIDSNKFSCDEGTLMESVNYDNKINKKKLV